MPPPAPTAASWRWSPTSSSFAPAASTWRWIAARAAVSVIADSSTTTRSPARSRHASSPSTGCGRRRRGRRRAGPGWRASGRRCARSGLRRRGRRWRSGWWPARTPAAPAPPRRSGSVQARASAPTTNDLPVPAGPTSDLDPGAGGEHAAHGGGLVDAELDARTRAARRGTAARPSVRQRRGAAGGGRRRRRARSVRTCSGVAYSCAPGAW